MDGPRRSWLKTTKRAAFTERGTLFTATPASDQFYVVIAFLDVVTGGNAEEIIPSEILFLAPNPGCEIGLVAMFDKVHCLECVGTFSVKVDIDSQLQASGLQFFLPLEAELAVTAEKSLMRE